VSAHTTKDLDDLREELAEAAVAAELDSGAREPTVAAAWASVALRLARMTAASVLLLLGALLLVLPGPGWLVIAVGLTLLARDVAWAERVLSRVRRRLPSGEDGRLTRPAVATMVTAGLASTAAMLWWTLR
jgi:hypothetical protein